MVTTPKTSLVAVLLCGALAAPVARAQVSAPAPVEEGEDAAEETPPERAAPAAARRDVAPVPAAAAEPGPAAGQPAGAADGQPAPEGAAAAPAPPPAPAAAADLARRIVPVSTTFAALMSHWAERREALREQDPARAGRAEEALLAAMRELGIENLPALSASEVRASAAALSANLPDLALRHAEAAVALAPDHADAHLALARARLALAPGEPRAVLAAVRDAIAAAAREPHTRRAFLGDLAAAGLAAFFTAAAGALALLFLRRARPFLHDFHHLPLLSGSHPIQAGFLALVLLATPAAFGLGAFAVLFALTLAVWLYLSRAERLVATLALGGLVALPWATGAAVRANAWTGTLAEQVHALEHGAPAEEDVAALAARAEAAPAPAAVYAALGRHAKRRGELEAALRLYAKAMEADPAAPELLVNVGNVQFLQGDLEGAKASYLAASDRAGPELRVAAAAHYDLSKLYLRTSDMEKSGAARDRAEAEDGAFLRAAGSDQEFAANRYLVDVPVPDAKIRALAASDGAPAAVEALVRARLFGGLPRGLWPAAPIAALVLLWAAALVGARLRPSRACERCGRAACVRCGGAATDALCGQCVNVFTRRGVVDARDRLRKEAEVARHAQVQRALARILAVVGVGAGHLQLGFPARGFAVALAFLFAAFLGWFWRGVLPPPFPSPDALAGKLAFAVPVGAALYAWAVRDVFRRTR